MNESYEKQAEPGVLAYGLQTDDRRGMTDTQQFRVWIMALMLAFVAVMAFLLRTPPETISQMKYLETRQSEMLEAQKAQAKTIEGLQELSTEFTQTDLRLMKNSATFVEAIQSLGNSSKAQATSLETMGRAFNSLAQRFAQVHPGAVPKARAK